MPDLQRILDTCWRYPFPLEFNPSLVGWGFTVYRTYYGPDSNENWNTLRNKAKEEANKELMACVYDGNDETAEKLKSLFRLDARSDPALLGGLSLAELCKVYKDKIGGEPEPVHQCCVFLVADEQILDQIGQGNLIINAVDADRMLDICPTHQCMCWAVDESELCNMVWEGCDGS
ncbi:hypothetical protein BKA59DRAFT_491872 [Fusarium tricinctum]|uniref:Uncharacterized protein n=1 Tax=Fusarium tricinctum TaxID=61284 RepID=A0A8K0S2V9_9HYPO|nr:hypothetical protein BKA59DRAFT_491872 [Fusarium tricinctum]